MANLKNTTINDTGFLQLPTGTTAQRPGTAAAGQMRYNTNTNSVESYDAEYSSWFPAGVITPVASGGTVANISQGGVNYRVHTFLSNGSFTVTRSGPVEFLIVAGGGGGGGINAGGGGGGGVLTGSTTLTARSYNVTVGTDGLGGLGYPNGVNEHGAVGSDSSAFGLTTFGGGGGASYNTFDIAKGTGGSGGGRGGGPSSQGAGYSGIPGQGNNGGLGLHRDGVFTAEGGGGGGGGGAAGSPATDSKANGGTGLNSYISGNTTFYAGGGGGGFDTRGADRAGSGGLGGGGNGTYGTVTAESGTANTGGGGGAAGYNANSNERRGGNGGSGIVIVRYRTS